jgi:hypothetical protein
VTLSTNTGFAAKSAFALLIISSIATAQSPSCTSVTAHVPNFAQGSTIDTSAKIVRVYANGVTASQSGYFQIEALGQWVGGWAQPQGDGSWFADIDITGLGNQASQLTLYPWLWNSSAGGSFAPCGVSTISKVGATSNLGISTGVNYNWTNADIGQCSLNAASVPALKNYADSAGTRLTSQQHLQQMAQNGVRTVRIFTGWGNNYYPAGLGVTIDPPQQNLPTWFINNLNNFLDDAANAGIETVVLGLGGEGSYGLNQDTNLDGLVIPTWKNAATQIVGATRYRSSPTIYYDLTNEVAPSNYEPAIQIARKKHYIRETWKHYIDSGFPADRASYSAILDDSTNFQIAGNRLANLVLALQESQRTMPSWFSVHTYAADSAAMVRMLRGAYQIYADFGFRSGDPSPKWTMIGESFHEHQASANGIFEYVTAYDTHQGRGIQIRNVLSWPVVPGYSYCSTSAQQVQSPLFSNILRAKLN